MKIQKITIEGMHNVDKKTYTFSDLTYLYGANGAGKSTVLQAIQLALLGYIPGTSKSSKAELFKHSNGSVLGVTLQLDDDGTIITIHRVWAGTSSNVTSSVEITPEGYNIEAITEELELPIFNFNEFVGMTANKMKEWFINFLPSSEMIIDWNKLMKDEARKAGLPDDSNIVGDEIDWIKKSPLKGSELVKAANTHFKDALSFKKKELERLQSTVQSLIFYDDLDSEVGEQEIKDQLSVYEAQKATRDACIRDAKRNKGLQDKLATEYAECTAESPEADPRYIEALNSLTGLESKKAELGAQMTELGVAVDKIMKQYDELVKKESAIQLEIATNQKIIDGNGICPFTSTKCESMQPLVEEYKIAALANTQKIEAINAEVGKLQAEKDAKYAEHKKVTSAYANLDLDKAMYNRTMSDVIAQYSMRDQLRSQIVIVPEVDETGDFDSKIAELKDLLVKYEANRKYNELIDTITANKYTIEQEIAAYKAWINLTGVNGLQNDDSATKPFIDLQDSMNKYIQAVFGEDVSSKFILEAKANSFSFGITRNDKYIPFNLLSSGEKCMYTLSLMMALTSVSASPLKLVMVDDLLDHLDDTNVLKLFDSLEKVDDIQMLFAGVKPLTKDYVVEVRS